MSQMYSLWNEQTNPHHKVSQAKKMKWVAISFSSREKWKYQSLQYVRSSWPNGLQPTDSSLRVSGSDE